tara:strand:- start:722 stop:955 length:234 start_codon:yes stop_codon:yes gene_type:complete
MSDNGKKYGYSSVDNLTGKRFNTASLFNFNPDKVKSKFKRFEGGFGDPRVNIGGGQLRPDIRKNYIGVKFTKEFKKR